MDGGKQVTSLVIAAHGTRITEGQKQCRALIDRVRRMLPDTHVLDCYVELDEPSVADAVADALANDEDSCAVVVPLMIGTGGHAQDDIPQAIAQAKAKVGGTVNYTPHLGPHPLLRQAALERISAAANGWTSAETSVVFLGRGTSLTATNADHVRLGRVLFEEGNFAGLTSAFIQVAQPDLTAGLDRAYHNGGRKIVVMPHYLFHGRLENWAHEQAAKWQESHPDAEVRVADVLGDCDEVASVVVERFERASATAPEVYLAGLVLTGKRVVIAGAGRIAARRVPKLVAAGAQVNVIAPQADPRIVELAEAGEVVWTRREVSESDLDEAWYCLALTNDSAVNAQFADWAKERRVFCVRGDDASGGSAWTPATGTSDGFLVGVVSGRGPHETAHARTYAVSALASR